MDWKSVARDWCPPVVRKWRSGKGTVFAGDYPSFDVALKDSEGYLSGNIVKAMVSAFQKADRECLVLDERAQQLLAAFGTLPGPLKVLDVGGAGGHYYFPLAKHLPYPIEWTVLETEPMVRAFSALEASPIRYVTEPTDADVILFSGSLQYLRDPYHSLANFAGLARYLIFNRLPLIDGRDRLTIQHVRDYYTSSYPAWFFSRHRFLETLSKIGRICMQWPSDTVTLDGERVPYSGLLVHLRPAESTA